jgi:biopolymer transport protein ExbD
MVVTINLPEGADQPVPQDDERLTIYVDVGGNFTLTQGVDPDTALSLDQEQLERELTTYYETDPNLAVFLRGDQDVNYGSVIDVLLMARRIGFQKVQAVIREVDGP